MEIIEYKKIFALHVKSISMILEKIIVTDVCKLLQIARMNAHSWNSVQAFRINGILVPFFKEDIKREEKATMHHLLCENPENSGSRNPLTRCKWRDFKEYLMKLLFGEKATR